MSNVIPARFLSKDENGKDIWITNITALTESELAEDGFVDFDEVEDIGDEAQWISDFLEGAREYELEVEVVQLALKAMKEDSRLTPAMAMRIGFLEWVK
jgi:hypothetical protein